MVDIDDSSKVKLTYFQGTGTIWNTQDWKKARANRIVGSFTGNLAHCPHQIKERGFPFMLTKNETTLLLEKNLAVLVDCYYLVEKPDDEVRHKCSQQQLMSFSQQVALLKEERKAEILEKADLIVEGKVAKRRKMNPDDTTIEETQRDAIIREELAKISDPAEAYLCAQIFTEDPWKAPEKQKSVSWTYPTTDAERLEYATFLSLWNKGHWVTSGGKFGGHFLAYPGDPLLYHAHFIVRLFSRNDDLDPLDIVAFSRLANSTKKTAVMAYFNSSGTISFQSLAWVNDEM